jgi:hypothetical protein
VTGRRISVPTPSYGWDYPWPNAFEVAAVFSTERWTLVGGLMVQAHALAHGIDVIRPTNDLDMVLHIEMVTGLAGEVNATLGGLGYRLREPSERKGHVYRYERSRPNQLGESTDVIDVMAPDHLGPHRAPRLGNSPMFAVPGGKQALGRTVKLAMTTGPGKTVEFSLPDELAALILKGAAHLNDRTPERERHLSDAAVLAATITDHGAERARLKGSDGKRLRHLREQLADERHPAWLRLPAPLRRHGQDTLRILTA